VSDTFAISTNVSEAVYVNALSLGRLLAYGLPRLEN
jgi:hypothetical protein